MGSKKEEIVKEIRADVERLHKLAADHIEIAIDALEEARMALARGGH